MSCLSAILIALINAARGSGTDFTQGNKVLEFLFSKWLVVAYFYGLALLATDYIAAGIFIIPIIFKFATGTGGLMQAYTESIIPPKEFAPFDWIANKIVGEPVDTLPKCRKWGVIYGSLVGEIFALPFIYTNSLYGLPLFLTGFVIGEMRRDYVRKILYSGFNDYRWRAIELLWFGFTYSMLYFLSYE